MKKFLTISFALFSSALFGNTTNPSSATQTAKDDQGIGRVNSYLWSQDPSGPDRRVPGDAGGRLETLDGTEYPISGATTYALSSQLTGTASSSITLTAHGGMVVSVTGTAAQDGTGVPVIVQWNHDNSVAGTWFDGVKVYPGQHKYVKKNGNFARLQIDPNGAPTAVSTTAWYRLVDAAGSTLTTGSTTISGQPITVNMSIISGQASTVYMDISASAKAIEGVLKGATSPAAPLYVIGQALTVANTVATTLSGQANTVTIGTITSGAQSATFGAKSIGFVMLSSTALSSITTNATTTINVTSTAGSSAYGVYWVRVGVESGVTSMRIIGHNTTTVPTSFGASNGPTYFPSDTPKTISYFNFPGMSSPHVSFRASALSGAASGTVWVEVWGQP